MVKIYFTLVLMGVTFVALPHQIYAQQNLYLEKGKQSSRNILPFDFSGTTAGETSEDLNADRRPERQIALVNAVQAIAAQKERFIKQYQRDAQEIANTRTNAYSQQVNQSQDTLDRREGAPDNRIMVYEREKEQTESQPRRLWNPVR